MSGPNEFALPNQDGPTKVTPGSTISDPSGSASEWTQFDPADFIVVDDSNTHLSTVSDGDGWYISSFDSGGTNNGPPNMYKFKSLVKSPQTDQAEVGRLEVVIEFDLAETTENAQMVVTSGFCDADGNANNVSDTHRVATFGLRTGSVQYHLVYTDTTSVMDEPTGGKVQDIAFVDLVASDGGFNQDWYGVASGHVKGGADTTRILFDNTVVKKGDLYHIFCIGNQIDQVSQVRWRAKYITHDTATITGEA